ncbi:hypothetical protein OHA40_12875 [Nocardia sp. NBC_00508]|uniref:hypothetical protein n=1 Tax=Nocardia sp. NBC_00508 TaxID=2975992 RepID=UPI002E7FBBA4|nr:hypothetical protein [Nocardia sp. NBC_00508]WUD68928.1 hypothetical protein OHA40_12875 [Nocardia sp. NBC_00508]
MTYTVVDLAGGYGIEVVEEKGEAQRSGGGHQAKMLAVQMLSRRAGFVGRPTMTHEWGFEDGTAALVICT